MIVRTVTAPKRCYGCSIGLAPEIRYREQLICGADTEVVLDNGQIVCLTCQPTPGRVMGSE